MERISRFFESRGRLSLDLMFDCLRMFGRFVQNRVAFVQVVQGVLEKMVVFVVAVFPA